MKMSGQPDPDAGKWSASKPLIVGVIGVLLLVGGFGGWSVFTNISGAIIAAGQIEVDQNRQVIQHPDGGVVEAILVQEGEMVAEGDLLVKLDPNLLQSELSIVENQLFELVARRGRLEAERDDADEIAFDPMLDEIGERSEELKEGQRRLFEARRDSVENEREQLVRRGAQIRDQIVGIEAQQAALATQLELIGRELVSQQSLLDRGLAQAARVLSLEREKADLSGRSGELAASIAQAEGRITELDIEVLRLGTARREEAITTLRDLQYNELELAERRRSLKGQLDRLDIRAPVSGIVYGMTVFARRSVIRPADALMYLVPQDRPLLIAARVEPTNIDQIYVNQNVIVRFSAFDQRRTPELQGRVQLVSADAFQDEATQVSYYRAEIVLSEGEIAKLPDDMTLIPGMPVESFIRTDDRTPMAYLMKPLSDYFAKAFRES